MLDGIGGMWISPRVNEFSEENAHICATNWKYEKIIEIVYNEDFYEKFCYLAFCWSSVSSVPVMDSSNSASI